MWNCVLAGEASPFQHAGELGIAFRLSARLHIESLATIPLMAETGATLTEQLEELGAQLDWVREYL